VDRCRDSLRYVDIREAILGGKIMFFVRGLSCDGKEVLVNPDQVLYVRPVESQNEKTQLVLTYSKLLIVDQDAETVRRRFEAYLADIASIDDNNDPEAVN
jgi:hypothetical protein